MTSNDRARYGSDFEVLSALTEWAEQGDRGALVTVAMTWGSSPRPAGSLLAIRQRDGQMVGSVSGGCVEADLVERYIDCQLADCPTMVDYGADPDSGSRLGLPCGARLELVVEEPAAATLHPVLEAIAAGRLIQRQVSLASGQVDLHAADGKAVFTYADSILSKQFGPQWRLLIVGAGQIADYLARIAMTLDFQVSMCDPRSDFSTELPAIELSRQMPDDLIRGLAQQPRTAVLALAHDPKVDDLALIAALEADFFFVGALGSRRSAEARRERLRSLDIDDQQIAQLRAPVGINIGSHTPPEIAVAIAADLIMARQRAESGP